MGQGAGAQGGHLHRHLGRLDIRGGGEGGGLTAEQIAALASIADVKAKTDQLVFTDGGDIVATLDGEEVTAVGLSQYTTNALPKLISILDDTNDLQTNQNNWNTATGFSTFDPDADTVANVTLVDTVTTNTDMRGTDGSSTFDVATQEVTVAGGTGLTAEESAQLSAIDGKTGLIPALL